MTGIEGLVVFGVIAVALVLIVKKFWPKEDIEPRPKPDPDPNDDGDGGDEEEEV